MKLPVVNRLTAGDHKYKYNPFANVGILPTARAAPITPTDKPGKINISDIHIMWGQEERWQPATKYHNEQA